jgi:hypothetical protein
MLAADKVKNSRRLMARQLIILLLSLKTDFRYRLAPNADE